MFASHHSILIDVRHDDLKINCCCCFFIAIVFIISLCESSKIEMGKKMTKRSFFFVSFFGTKITIIVIKVIHIHLFLAINIGHSNSSSTINRELPMQPDADAGRRRTNTKCTRSYHVEIDHLNINKYLIDLLLPSP